MGDGGRWPVSREGPVGGEPVGVGAFAPGGRQRAPRLLPGPPEGERLPLREAARDEEAVVVAAGPVPGFGRDDELHRRRVGPLVEELEEGVLGVGSGLAPDDGRGRPRGRGAVPRDALAVRLHRELLDVGRKSCEALVVGHEGDARPSHDVAAPDRHEAQQDRQVPCERGLAEVSGPWPRRRRAARGTAPGRRRSPPAARWPTRGSSARRPSPGTRTPARPRSRIPRPPRRWTRSRPCALRPGPRPPLRAIGGRSGRWSWSRGS